MCGIVGVVNGDPTSLRHQLTIMSDALVHRGPDGSGIWIENTGAVGLAHRRLAIVDLTPAGAQPMQSRSGRYQIVFNGEVYNHANLRKSLIVQRWRGHSDTETLLEAVEQWGIVEAIRKSVGMFALGLWDNAKRTLTLCRDRFGEKPLYYGKVGEAFVFASELKALRACQGFDAKISREAIAAYLIHNYIPAPLSVYEGIQKLEPGATLTISERGQIVEQGKYWSLDEIVDKGQSIPFRGSAEEAAEELDRLMRDAVALQLLADVPVGAFLSGGIDSSLVVAIGQAMTAQPIRTFTIGFHQTGYNEAHFAKAVAQHLGTQHCELYVGPEIVLEAITKMPRIYDEPFSDSSQIPTYCVAQLARNDVTVAISGDAGDELFGGYSRYLIVDRLWRKLERTPAKLRKLSGNAIRSLNPGCLNRFGELLSEFVPRKFSMQRLGDRLHKLGGLLLCGSKENIYAACMTHWANTGEIMHEPYMGRFTSIAPFMRPELDFVQQMMFHDTRTYLPDDILVKVDRASMAVGLETRTPFLDHRIAEFAWSLPVKHKVRNGIGKLVVRQALERYVPRTLTDRPKQGFGVPLDAWLRGPLREWAEHLLSPTMVRNHAVLRPEAVIEKWEEHKSGKRNWQYLLWDIIMLQAWLESAAKA